MYKAAVIVTICNEYALTENFFSWILPQLPKDFQIIAVIDGITDTESMEYLKRISRAYSSVSLYTLDKNQGFSAANNYAVSMADSEYLVFLNSDTFPEAGSMETLVNFLEDNEGVGAVQGLILSPQDDKVQSAGHIFAFYKTTHAFAGRNRKDSIVQKQTERQALASGFCAMRADTFHRYNGFDEIYYNAWEGLELTLKIHLGGLKCMYIPDAVAYHVKGSGRNRLYRDETYQSAYFWSKWDSQIEPDLISCYREQLPVVMREKHFCIINAGSYRFNIWQKLLSDLLIYFSSDYTVALPVNNRRVSFEDSIPVSILRSGNSMLFLTDSFQTITANARMFRHRQYETDLILDLNGNAICPQEYLPQSGIEAESRDL